MEKIKTSYSFKNSIITISFDDGKGNILDHIMMDELQYVFDALTKKEELKLIIFEGTGKHFSFPIRHNYQDFLQIILMLLCFYQLYNLSQLS